MPRRVLTIALVVTSLLVVIGVPAASAQPVPTDVPSATSVVASDRVETQLACGPNTAGDRPISRDAILRRGLSWITAKVPYSAASCRTDANGSYRTDCSGFVSMAWRLGYSWTTSTLAGITKQIDFDALQPGDALNKPGTHVVLFAGWSSTDAGRHRYFDYYAQTHTGDTARASVNQDLQSSRWIGYVAVRYDKVADSLGDFDSDGHADLLAHEVGAPLQVHPGEGDGTFADELSLRADVTAVDRVLAPADFDDDHRPDVVARGADGTLWIYRGTGNGKIGAAEQISDGGWLDYDRILMAGDLDGDGNADLVARSRSGPFFRFSGTGTGTFGEPVRIGRGWTEFDKIAAPGDVDGDNLPDIVVRKSGGRMWVFHGDGTGGLRRRTEVPGRWRRYDKLVAPGDFDGDGKVDLIGRTPDGSLWLHRGLAADRFRAPVAIPGNWKGYESIV